jgi:hypothetical protein
MDAKTSGEKGEKEGPRHGVPTIFGKKSFGRPQTNLWQPLPKKTNLIFQFLQQTIQDATVLRTMHVLHASSNPPGLKLKTFDFGNQIGLWIINCAHRQPP